MYVPFRVVFGYVSAVLPPPPSHASSTHEYALSPINPPHFLNNTLTYKSTPACLCVCPRRRRVSKRRLLEVPKARASVNLMGFLGLHPITGYPLPWAALSPSALRQAAPLEDEGRREL